MAIPKDARIGLSPEDIPKRWYNMAADIPDLKPMINPTTKAPVTEDELATIFCKPIIRQELSKERYIDIPEEVRDAYVSLNRPSPIQRAYRLEKYLRTPAKIYFKREDMSPLGSHKGNTALAQAYYNAEAGVHTLTTETGAGQWGTALAMVSNLFDIKSTIFMVAGSYDSKPLRKSIVHLYGATIYRSPSEMTEYGRKVLKEHPETSGSLGIAISEACEMAAKDEHTCYALGSVMNHVMLHQTVIGEECLKQFEIGEIEPDYMIACVGGGSNFAGFAFPFLRERAKGRFQGSEVIAVEPKATPSLTKGKYMYDYGDTAGMTPMMMMYTLGSQYIPPSIHAGGLRYHGMSPLVSAAFAKHEISAVSYDQTDTFQAGITFARTEGIIPAPESCHALKCAIDKALECKEKGEEKTIVFNLSGHGLLDLYGYDQALAGTLPSSENDSFGL